MRPPRAAPVLALALLLRAGCGGSGTAAGAHHEYCVVGAGPAGLQLAAQLTGRDYIVLERAAAPGSFLKKYPRHRRLISINKRYTGRASKEFNLRHDWNSLLRPDGSDAHRPEQPRFGSSYSEEYFPHADSYVRYLADYAQGLNVRYGATVERVARSRAPRGGAAVRRGRYDAFGLIWLRNIYFD